MSVRLQTFLLSKDKKVGQPILSALERAARRGVKVQIMEDGMAPKPVRRLFITGEREAIQQIQQLEQEGLPISFRRPIERGNGHSVFQRDHTKNIVIDAEAPEKSVGFIGGRNIWKKDIENRDFMIRLQGELVDILKLDFDRTWEGIDIFKRTYKDSSGNLIVSDVRNTDEIPYMIVERMRTAAKRIWIETPYYDRLHLSALLISLKRDNPDLDIRLLTPQPVSNNHLNYKISSHFYMKELAQNGISVYAYEKGDTLRHHTLDHGKALLIDDEAIVGSSNFSQRKMLGGMNAEMELFTKDTDFIAQLTDWFASGFAKAELKKPKRSDIFDVAYRLFRRQDHSYL